jgi:hypothetical protein
MQGRAAAVKTVNMGVQITYRLGPWTGGGPHERVEELGWMHPANRFGVIWADKRHEQPVAVVDHDGCRAEVLGELRRRPLRIT